MTYIPKSLTPDEKAMVRNADLYTGKNLPVENHTGNWRLFAREEKGEVFVIQLPGQPQSKQRPRLGKGVIYTPNGTRQAERAIGLLFKSKFPGHRPDKKNRFGIRILFQCGPQHGRRGDVDNMAKLVLDALNGVLWKDDSQVAEICAKVIKKVDHPSTTIYAYTIPDKESI